MDDVAVTPETCTRARASRILAAFVALLGSLVLFGWAFRLPMLKSVLPGYVAMNPATAVSFVVLAAGILCSPTRPQHARAAGLLVAALTMLKLVALATAWPVAVDQLLFSSELDQGLGAPPNRMAPNTAASLLLLGLALLSLGTRVGKVRISEVLAFFAGLNGFFALVGYSYGVRTFYRIGVFIPMAAHTAAALLLSAWALLFVRADHGVAALLFRASPAGEMARRLVPAALFLPAVLGWVRLWGERRGFYPTDVGVALFAVTLTLVLLVLVFLTARALEGTDAMRVRAQQQLEEVALRLSAANQELERLATTDGLTGVSNRRAWLARGAVEVASARRYGTSLSVLMIDADHFKRINDVHGHDAGDRALSAMAECLKTQLRVIDLVGRYGGEEFCVLLPHTDVEGAMVVAERCCAAIRNLVVFTAGSQRVHLRCSIGVAELTEELAGIHELVQVADQALFTAKVERDCVRRALAPAASLRANDPARS